MVFKKLGIESLKFQENHTEILLTIRVEKILRVIRVIQINQKLGRQLLEQ